MLKFLNVIAIAASVGLLSFSSSPAIAFSGGSFASCSDPKLISYISKRFRYAERHLLQNGEQIESISNAHMNRYVPGENGGLVDRVYCHGNAHMSNGRKRTIWYMIESGMGYAGMRDNVEFCIAGLDKLYVHGAWCRSVR